MSKWRDFNFVTTSAFEFKQQKVMLKQYIAHFDRIQY